MPEAWSNEVRSQIRYHGKNSRFVIAPPCKQVLSGVSGVVWPAHGNSRPFVAATEIRAHASHARSIPGTDTVRQPPEVLVAACDRIS